MGHIRSFFRRAYNKANAARLKNKDFSVISSNCNGAFILHDLGMPFNSPFVNLWIKPDDFVKMLKNLHYYLDCDLQFIEEDHISYPVGCLDDIKIYFQHYSSPEDAKAQWVKRMKRMNFDNLFILATDRDGCTYQNLIDFDALPYENKIIFTHISYPEFKSAYYLEGWESESSVGMCFDYKNRFTIKKHYDEFDYVSWFNRIT